MKLDVQGALLRIVPIFRAINIANRKPLFAILSDLGATSRQISILSLLYPSKELSIGDLTRQTGLDPTTMSRHVDRLKRMKLIIMKTDTTDARRRLITLSTRGNEICLRYEKENNRSNGALIKNLNAREISEFAEIMMHLADSMSARGFVPPPIAHPLRAPFRRVGEALGLLDENVGGSDLAVSEWHCLGLLANSSGVGIPAIQISETLGCARASLQALLTRLNTEGLISFLKPSGRKRSSAVSITDNGRSRFISAEQALAEMLRGGIESMSPRDRGRLLLILDKLELPHVETSISEDFSFEKIINQEKLGVLRGRIIDFFTANHLSEEAGSSLLNPEHINFLVKEGNELAAIVEFGSGGKSHDLYNACFFLPLSPEARLHAVRECHKRTPSGGKSGAAITFKAPYLSRFLGAETLA